MSEKLKQIFEQDDVLQTDYFKDQWEQYEKNFKTCEQNIKSELQLRYLRMFNIRFRIALDLKTDFHGVYSMTKTPAVKKAYIELFTLLQFWNAYEALISYRSCTEGKEKFYELDTPDFLQKTGSNEILKSLSEQIKTDYYSDESYKTDFDQYIEKILPKVKYPKPIKDFYEYIQNKNDFVGVNIINLIYAERNLSYHEGEAVRLGWDYGRRTRLITMYKKAMICHCLNTINYVLEEEIKHN